MGVPTFNKIGFSKNNFKGFKVDNRFIFDYGRADSYDLSKVEVEKYLEGYNKKLGK
jgi:hypothetical protein